MDCLFRRLRHRVRIGNHRYERAALVAFAEGYLAVAKREERVVLAHADIGAGMELGTALTHDDVAAGNLLAAEHLHTQHLGVGVATVAGRTACFLVCHGSLLARVNFGDLHFREVLTVATLAVRGLAALFLEGDDLLAAAVLDDLTRHGSTLAQRRAGFRAVATEHQDLAKRDRATGIADELFDGQDIVLGNTILFPAGADDREHGLSP